MNYKPECFCEHANECPANSGPLYCECPKDCACRERMCKPLELTKDELLERVFPNHRASPPSLPLQAEPTTLTGLAKLTADLQGLKQQLETQLAQSQNDNDMKLMLAEFQAENVAQLHALVKEKFASLHAQIQHERATYSGYEFKEVERKARVAQQADELQSAYARIRMLEARDRSEQL